MNWSRILQWNTEKHSNKECLAGLGKRQTYGDVYERVNSLAQGLLDLGIRRGDVVAILLYNCCEYLEITFAVNQVGAVWLPLNFRLAGDEFHYILENSGAKALVTEPEFVPTISAIRPSLAHLEHGLVTQPIRDSAPKAQDEHMHALAEDSQAHHDPQIEPEPL